MTIWPEIQKYLSPLGDIASIAGLALTVVVFYSVRRIKEFYLFRARIPELAELLATKIGILATLLADYANRQQQVQIEIDEVAVLVRSVRDKSKGTLRANAKQVLRVVDQRKGGGAKGSWDVYREVNMFVAALRETQRDLDWR